ncbi:MAG: AAA family ATPase [Prevotella sp.]|jgi:predicted ATPase|nr:AAA family ATPase [Prevotella sp.]
MDYIKIKGYKSIKDLKLDLMPINVLIGANGAGKSNFISFFNFLKTAYDGELKSFVTGRGIDTVLHNGRKETESIFTELCFDDAKNAYDFCLKVENKTFVVQSESLWYESVPRDIADSSTELKVRTSGLYRAKYINSYLNGLKVYHFHDTGVNSPFNSDCKVIDNRTLQSKGGNLAAFLYKLKTDDEIVYNRIVKVIQSVAPYFKDFELVPNGDKIFLAWRDKFSENLYGASDLSDGTIRFIALATLFLQPDPPAVIIIDEPELGLHPFAINKLAGLVRSYARQENKQVILSTQSVELVNNFSAEEVITVDNIDGESVFNRLQESELSEWLKNDYMIGDMWRQNILSKGFPNR